jgi:hypothetical protein
VPTTSVLARTSSQSAFTFHPDGQIDIHFPNLPSPDRRFSADAAVAQVREEIGSMDIFFVSLGPSFTAPRQFVRVRFPLDSLETQLTQDEAFFQGTLAFLGGTGALVGVVTPSIEALDRVGEDRSADIDGTVMYLARSGQTAMIDVFRIAPDAGARIQAGKDLDVSGQLRIELPTRVLCKLLIDLREGVKIGAKPQ